ncbi:FecR family protein [Hephaestia caeni]|uniref:FecR family protein n=1 Tax=Hephaestia caeni TaxID=645617 RepID=A0A397PBB9_9SPHN|nr:FecR domain-containing protein [Hephaestia caeni]RIA46248.1 FecR family protein [Hephaestia caeni]
MSGKDRKQNGLGVDRATVAAWPDQVHHTKMEGEKDEPPESWLNESGAPRRHMKFAWREATRLPEHPDYADLLGTPTFRERFVEIWHRLSEARLPAISAPRVGLACVVAVLIFSGVWILRPGGPDYVTQVAEVREVPLVDGSVVTLGARSALDVAFTNRERQVRLAKGEAFFAVSHDPERPFIVLAGGRRIRVVGTKFNVKYDGNRVRVSVLEGVVNVSRGSAASDRSSGADRSAATPTVRVVGGQQLMVPATGPFARPQSLHGAEPGAWRKGRLDYQDAPLAEIVSDAARYYPHAIRISSPSLASERLTTSFRTTQIDQMLETLPNTLPIIVRRDEDGTVRLERNASAGE